MKQQKYSPGYELLPQFCSSLPSLQFLTELHRAVIGTHCPSAQVNWSDIHPEIFVISNCLKDGSKCEEKNIKDNMNRWYYFSKKQSYKPHHN